MFKKTFYSISVFCAVALTSAAVLTGCDKSSSDSSSEFTSFSGDKLTVTHNDGKFLAPENATVSVNYIGDGTAIVKMDRLITGFPSVIEKCTVKKSNDTTYFTGETSVSPVEKIGITGYSVNDKIKLNYAETITSPTTKVEKWMIGEKEDSLGNKIPDVEIKIEASELKLKELSEIGTTLLESFFIDQSRFFDYVTLASDGSFGIYHEDYHADSVITHEQVNQLWSAVRAGFYIGDIVSPGPLGQLSFFQKDSVIGVTMSNAFIEIFNQFSRVSIDVPFYVPFQYKVTDTKLDIYLNQDVMQPLLMRYYSNIMSFLNQFTYDKFLEVFPEELKELVKELVPKEDYELFISIAKQICDLIVNENTDLTVHMSFAKYEKVLRPWEAE